MFIVGNTLRADEKRGCEILLQRSPREVIVAAAIDQHAAIFIRHGAEQNGVRHRGTHGKGQVAVLILHGLVAIDVRCDAAIGYHQLIEVAATRHRGGGEEFVKRHIYLRGVDKSVRQGEVERRAACHGVAFHIDIYGEHRGYVLTLGVEEFIAVVNLSRHPILHVARGDNSGHLLDRIARGVECADDGTHRCTRHVVDRYVVLLQRLNNSDVVQALGSATGQHKANLTLGGAHIERVENDARSTTLKRILHHTLMAANDTAHGATLRRGECIGKLQIGECSRGGLLCRHIVGHKQHQQQYK